MKITRVKKQKKNVSMITPRGVTSVSIQQFQGPNLFKSSLLSQTHTTVHH